MNVVNEAPVVMASDQTLKIGDSFDPQVFLNSISASDKEDTKNQLTPTISVDEETLYSIRTDISGVYKIAVMSNPEKTSSSFTRHYDQAPIEVMNHLKDYFTH
ncbi:hypothetical protein EfmAA290_18800 [Enterococcus faecium]|nr:hypothetical protein EfmAA290_18800 [Enterococcus faecium]